MTVELKFGGLSPETALALLSGAAAFVKEYRGYIESIFKKARKTA